MIYSNAPPPHSLSCVIRSSVCECVRFQLALHSVPPFGCMRLTLPGSLSHPVEKLSVHNGIINISFKIFSNAMRTICCSFPEKSPTTHAVRVHNERRPNGTMVTRLPAISRVAKIIPKHLNAEIFWWSLLKSIFFSLYFPFF